MFSPLGRMRSAFLLLGSLAVPAGADAQIVPLTVPKGQVRFDFWGRFDNYDHRFHDGEKEEAAGDFDRPALDGTYLSTLADAETRLRRITGIADLRLSLGRPRVTELVNIGTAGLGAALGLTSRITLFGTVPIVRVRVQPTFHLDSLGATAAFNPADPVFGGGGGTQTAVFFAQFGAALTALRTSLQSGAYDSVPALKTMAQQTLDQATMLRDELFALIVAPATASPFLPRTGTAAATQLLGLIQTLQATLAGPLGVPGFTQTPGLPSAPLTGAQFAQFVTDPNGPIQGRPFDPPTLSVIGDIELGAALLWLDRFPRSTGGSGIRSVAQGLVRLPTGQLDRSDRFFDVGTGDGHLDLDLSLATDLALGRLGARLTGAYTLQFPGSLTRRVAPPEQPIAPASRTAEVRRDPGEIWRVSVQPFFQLASSLSLFAGVEQWHKASDRFEYAAGQQPIEGVDVSVLNQGTAASATTVSAGVSFAHSGAGADGTGGRAAPRRGGRYPLDASLRYDAVVASGQGRVPETRSVRMEIRFYTKFW